MQAYGYFKDGEIVAPVAMCSRFNDVGAWHTLTDEERAMHGWYPCVVEDNEFNPQLQYKGTPNIEFIGEILYYSNPILDKDIWTIKSEISQNLFQRIQELKLVSVEVEGINLSISDIQKLVILLGCTTKCVYIESGSQICKISKDTLPDTITKLIDFEQSILKLQYDIQSKLEKALSIKDLVDIDIQGSIANILEK